MKNNPLEEALALVDGERQSDYGHPADNFALIGRLTEPVMGAELEPELQHALYMIQVKIARLLESPYHYDSLLDIAGYVQTYWMCVDKLREIK